MSDPLNPQRLKVAIDLPKSRVAKPLFDALAGSVRRLGHELNRDLKSVRQDPEAISILWWRKGYRRPKGRVLFCENGWLPRWEFQIDEQGINADSSLAPWPGTSVELSDTELHALEKRLARLRSGEPTGNDAYSYALAEQEPCALYREPYLLAPLQMPQDTNMRHVPRGWRKAQDFVERITALDPPLPLLFKQHPMDANHGNEQLLLRMGRPGDRVHPHRQGNIHSLLKSALCKAVVTLNSNVVHDAILWGLPAAALSRGVWGGPGGDPGPFITSLGEGWDSLLDHLKDSAVVQRRKAYAHWLLGIQWSVGKAENPGYVARLLAGRL